MKTRSVTTTEKMETFASQLEGVFTNEIQNTVFDEEVKTGVDDELDQPIARVRLNFPKVIPFDPDIHSDRKHHLTNEKLFELTQAVCQAQCGRHISRYRKCIIQSLTQRLTLRTVTHECTRFAAQMDFQLSKGSES